MDLFEAMNTCRTMRYIKPDPISRDTVKELIHYATRAANPGNSQGWRFIILDEQPTKDTIAGLVKEKFLPVMANAETPNKSFELMKRGAVHLMENWAKVPVWILVCGRNAFPPQQPMEQYLWGTLYPASQNLMLAARGMGLAATVMEWHTDEEKAFVRGVLNVPDDVYFASVIGIGHPDLEKQKFGPVKRNCVEDVICWNHWEEHL